MFVGVPTINGLTLVSGFGRFSSFSVERKGRADEDATEFRNFTLRSGNSKLQTGVRVSSARPLISTFDLALSCDRTGAYVHDFAQDFE